jgi:hypothetical protein
LTLALTTNVSGGGFIEIAQIPVSQPEIIMELRNPIVPRNCALQKSRGLLETLCAERDQTEHVQTVHMLGIDREHLFANLLGLREAPGLHMTNCNGEHFAWI